MSASAATTAANSGSDPVGDLLRRWRGHRRFSQLELALEAEVSSRHLSFIETGRAAASRELLHRLADSLRMPPRARNELLLAAGFAPLPLGGRLDAPELREVREAVTALLKAHDPYPAIAIDQRWMLLEANQGASLLLAGVDPELLQPPTSVLRLTLDARGLASAIENLTEWRHHLVERLRLRADETLDPELEAAIAEVMAHPTPLRGRRPSVSTAGVAIPLVFRASPERPRLSFLSTTTVFGTATSVALAELAIECFYPADEQTRRYLLERKV